MQWKRRKVKRDYYHIIIKFPLKNISLQIEARSTFLWLNPSYILNSKSRNTVLLLKHGVWWVFSSKTLLDFKETLITLLVVRPKLEWASNYEMKEEGHLLQTKESRELLSWISSKEKFMPDNKTFTTISDETWAIIQTRWNGFVCASEDQAQQPNIDWWDHLESWRKMIRVYHRGLLLLVFIDSGHSRRFIPIPGNILKMFYVLHISWYLFDDWYQIFCATLTILSGVLFREWLLLIVCRGKTKNNCFRKQHHCFCYVNNARKSNG